MLGCTLGLLQRWPCLPQVRAPRCAIDLASETSSGWTCCHWDWWWDLGKVQCRWLADSIFHGIASLNVWDILWSSREVNHSPWLCDQGRTQNADQNTCKPFCESYLAESSGLGEHHTEWKSRSGSPAFADVFTGHTFTFATAFESTSLRLSYIKCTSSSSRIEASLSLGFLETSSMWVASVG